MKRETKLPAGKLVCVLVLLCAGSIGIRAATIPVTNIGDTGPGSLRAALATATNGDTIDATGLSGTITLTNGPLFVTNSVNINGPGPVNLAIDGNFPNTTNRVFFVNGGVTVSITGLTISNGNALNGGGILNARSDLTVSNCALVGNYTSGPGGGIQPGRRAHRDGLP